MSYPGIGRMLIALVIGVILMFALPHFVEYYTLTLLIAYAMLALSLGLIWGFGGILCFGQAAFFGLGAYAYAISAINIGESTLPVFIAILVPALFAAALGAMMFYGRISDVYMGVITLVVTLILFKAVNSTSGEQYVIGTARIGGYNGIPGFQTLNVPGDPGAYLWEDGLYYVSATALLAVYALVRWLLASPFGRIMVAIRENETRMELLGYDARLRKTVLFTIGGAIAGLSGCLYANWAEIVTPTLFGLGQSAEIIIWVIIGGIGTLTGPMLGAAILGYLQFALGQQALINNFVVMGLILVFAVLVMPKGLVPTVTMAWNALRGQKP